jgi:4-methyl-5(b-hydroxyethyl)-thiazole monophosphate biosynthesis
MSLVLIPLAPGFEEIEEITLIYLFRRAAMTVIVAATMENPVRASRGVVVVADVTLHEVLHQDFDLIALPGGGKGADNLANDERIVRLVQKQYQAGKWLGAICAAPKVLASAGLLQGKKVTSFPGALDASMGIDYDWIDQPVVVDGKVVTSKGPGTAMDFALTLIELLEGKAKKLAVEGPLQRPHAPS